MLYVCTPLFALFSFSMTTNLLETFMAWWKMPIKKAISLFLIYCNNIRLFALHYTRAGHLLNGSKAIILNISID